MSDVVVLQVWVPGQPKTKGSLTPINSGRLTGRPVLRDSEASRRWRQLVRYRVENAMREATRAFPLDGPVQIFVLYHLNCTEEELIEQGSGDIDKLDRNLLDALQDAGLYHNDAQVVRCWSDKVVAVAPREPGMGVAVKVRE